MKVYAARDKNTGKLVNDITSQQKKFWEKEMYCKLAIERYNERERRRDYDLELVAFELVEVGAPASLKVKEDAERKQA